MQVAKHAYKKRELSAFLFLVNRTMLQEEVKIKMHQIRDEVN